MMAEVDNSDNEETKRFAGGYVLAMGESLIDAITEEHVADLSQARKVEFFAGGSPANFCRFLKTRGVEARLVAAVGADGLGKILIQDMELSGLSTEYIQQLDNHFTSVIMVARTTGTPDFLPYRDADKFLHPVNAQLIKNASLVHSTAFALSFNPARTAILDAFTQANRMGIPTSVDWNYAEKIWGAKNDAEEVFKTLLSFKPILKFSLDDAERFFKKPLKVEEAKMMLGALPAAIICLTCGAEGVWYKSEVNGWNFTPAQPVKVKDATGAGDAFWAGVISAYLRKSALSVCVDFGIAAAGERLSGLI